MITSILHTILLISLNLNMTNNHLLAPAPTFLCASLQQIHSKQFYALTPHFIFSHSFLTVIYSQTCQLCFHLESLHLLFPLGVSETLSLNMSSLTALWMGRPSLTISSKHVPPKGLQTVLSLFYILTSLVYTLLHAYGLCVLSCFSRVWVFVTV